MLLISVTLRDINTIWGVCSNVFTCQMVLRKTFKVFIITHVMSHNTCQIVLISLFKNNLTQLRVPHLCHTRS